MQDDRRRERKEKADKQQRRENEERAPPAQGSETVEQRSKLGDFRMSPDVFKLCVKKAL